MGGNLLKKFGLPESRIPREQYDKIANEIIEKFKSLPYHSAIRKYYHGQVMIMMRAIPSLRNKESHGDIDFVVGSDQHCPSYSKELNLIKQFIKDEFGYDPHCNDQTYSFPYLGYQMDIKFVQDSDFSSYLNYGSWGDCSNLMGKIFNKIGLHYGHKGLSYWINNNIYEANPNPSNNYVLEKVVLTTDMRTICVLGGFNYSKWFDGFDDEEEVFRFIAESRFFKKDIFYFENLNHINKTRNRKRSMYANFIKWCQDVQPPDNINNYLSKDEYFTIYQNYFPILSQAVGRNFTKYNTRKLSKSKINSSILMEKYGIEQGPRLGKIMSTLKERYSDVNIIELNPEELDTIIKEIIYVCGN